MIDDWSKIKEGDTVEVKAVHFRMGYRTMTRKVVQSKKMASGRQQIGIQAFGYNPFVLDPVYDRILSHTPG